MKRLSLLLAVLALTVCGHGMTREQAIQQAVAWRIQAAADRSFSFVLPTGSMRPTITDNAILLLEHVNIQDLRVGDIAVYESNNGTSVVHRITAISRSGWLYFSGDHNRRSDGWVAPEQIRWRVVRILNFNP